MDKKFTEKESLDLIVDMIENAKTKIQTTKIGYHFLLWGYLVTLAGLGNFIFYGHRWASIGWLAMLPIGVIGGFIIGRREAMRTARVYTYIDRIIGNVWAAFAIGMGIMLIPGFGLISLPAGSSFFFYPVLLALAAAALFVSGTAYKFKPLKIGALVCWAFAIACFFVAWRYKILLYTIAFIVGYIIPGHMLIHHNSKSNKNV